MPAVEIYHRHGFMGDLVADAIKKAVGSFGADRFSTSELQLNEEDFSFSFFKTSRHDSYTNDIIVRVRLDSNQERIHAIDDSLAKDLADYLTTQLFPIFTEKRLPTVGVELSLFPIAWGTNQ